MKLLCYTDIHFGRKRGSEIHNQDCLDFIEWMLIQAKEQKIDTIAFLGDFFETRTSIDTRTLNYAQEGLEMIQNAKHIKNVYHCTGNHDLHHRNNRTVNSLPQAKPLTKFTLINEPLMVDEILFVPYLFKHEYNILKETDARFILGHLEFNGFTMTGNYEMKTGCDSRYISGPDLVASGHFHTRQLKRNIAFIGNTFPMDFSDVGDVKRGVAIIDTDKKKGKQLSFIDWEDCPSYTRCSLSQLMEDPNTYLHPKGNVECVMDVDITYLEAIEIRKELMEGYSLRSFALKDANKDERDEAIEEGDVSTEVEIDVEMCDMDGMVVKMLHEVDSPSIDNDKLTDMYKGI